MALRACTMNWVTPAADTVSMNSVSSSHVSRASTPSRHLTVTAGGGGGGGGGASPAAAAAAAATSCASRASRAASSTASRMATQHAATRSGSNMSRTP